MPRPALSAAEEESLIRRATIVKLRNHGVLLDRLADWTTVQLIALAQAAEQIHPVRD